ncbi:hypothetical protein BTUL_0096g00100 [Botrytis tulipae]|uniref:Uncharacterized protein n=1 Tax=Botrytis tulipae TaxID=87230 RepID=A0A4Z1ENQ8_9HELO|nr:hypothetical protein BTUL_0096g00100 [Botrytis tulipae]
MLQTGGFGGPGEDGGEVGAEVLVEVVEGVVDTGGGLEVVEEKSLGSMRGCKEIVDDCGGELQLHCRLRGRARRREGRQNASSAASFCFCSA